MYFTLNYKNFKTVLISLYKVDKTTKYTGDQLNQESSEGKYTWHKFVTSLNAKTQSRRCGTNSRKLMKITNLEQYLP